MNKKGQFAKKEKWKRQRNDKEGKEKESRKRLHKNLSQDPLKSKIKKEEAEKS